MPISQYKIMIEQALNIGNLYRQGKFEFLDSEEKRKEFIEQIEFFKNKGKL